MAKMGSSRWERREVEQSSGGGLLELASYCADGNWRDREVNVDNGGGWHEIVTTGAVVSNGGAVQG